jgi:alginate O-acetyltransferase complex protein AlgI
MPKLAGWALTMVFVLFGWVVFRAASFLSAKSILTSLLGLSGLGGEVQQIPLLLAAALVSALVPSAHEIIEKLKERPHRALAVSGALLGIYCVLKAGDGAPTNFIYFQF